MLAEAGPERPQNALGSTPGSTGRGVGAYLPLANETSRRPRQATTDATPCDSRDQGDRCACSGARAVATASCPVPISTPKGSPEAGGSRPPSLPAFSTRAP